MIYNEKKLIVTSGGRGGEKDVIEIWALETQSALWGKKNSNRDIFYRTGKYIHYFAIILNRI